MKRKTVPDSWSSNTEASLAEQCPGSRANMSLIKRRHELQHLSVCLCVCVCLPDSLSVCMCMSVGMCIV